MENNNIHKKLHDRSKILVTIFLTTIIIIGGYFAWQGSLDKLDDSYNEGFGTGYNQGLLYTYQTGNIILVQEDGNLTEKSFVELCNNLVQNQLNQMEVNQNG